ncbi:MAG TPA: hypothetical protein VNN73_04535 [Blastocatellia bacterium]|jgi:hypothetical protein|nr:hypothetical protein [Blastocatellia bacterium]
MSASRAKTIINEQALEVALAAAQKLSRPAQHLLAERLLQGVARQSHTIIVPLQQFDVTTQRRFQELMDRNNEGRLTQAERRELASLVRRYEEMMLANSQALARASRPELFDEAGRLVKSRLDQALRWKMKEKRASNHKS